MNKHAELFNPDKEPNYSKITLKQLYNKDRLDYDVGAYKDEDRARGEMEYCKNKNKSLLFYVDEKTSLELPLRIKVTRSLTDILPAYGHSKEEIAKQLSKENPRIYTLTPNQPLLALKYVQTNPLINEEELVNFDVYGIYLFDSQLKFVNSKLRPYDKKAYYDDSESAWKSDFQGAVIEATTTRKMTTSHIRSGRVMIMNNSITTIRYTLSEKSIKELVKDKK